jgi:hypothetical protein
MRRNCWPVLHATGLLLLLLSGCNPVGAQPLPPASAKTAPSRPAISEQDVSETREHLLALLRISPTLTEVVAADPSLLANQEYVDHNNPELGKFLQDHPEVARNPDFYLFADLPGGGRRSEKLIRRTWSGQFHDDNDRPSLIILREVGPPFMLLLFFGTLIWLIRILLENRRWGRIFKMQTEVHGRLIEKLTNNEELLSYMNTDAGKRFLEAAPIPIDMERDRRIPAALSRVLVPLQGGVVLALLGIGLLSLRSSLPDISASLLVFGIVILMPGIGLILSAGITWLLAARLGLMQHEIGDAGDRS